MSFLSKLKAKARAKKEQPEYYNVSLRDNNNTEAKTQAETQPQPAAEVTSYPNRNMTSEERNQPPRFDWQQIDTNAPQTTPAQPQAQPEMIGDNVSSYPNPNMTSEERKNEFGFIPVAGRKNNTPQDGSTSAEPTTSSASTTGGAPDNNNAETNSANPANYGLSEENYNWLVQNGVSPEVIAKAQSYDPKSDGGFLTQFYKNTHKEPELNEAQLRTARNVAGLGDALSILAQLFASNKGAYVAPRSNAQTAMGIAQQREAYLRNLYENKRNRYDTGLYGAMTSDYQRGLAEQNQAKAEIRNALNQKRAYEYRQDQVSTLAAYRDQQLQLKAQAEANRQTEKAAELALKAEQAQARIDQINNSMKNQDARTRIAATKAASGSGGSRSSSGTGRSAALNSSKSGAKRGKNEFVVYVQDDKGTKNVLGKNYTEVYIPNDQKNLYLRNAAEFFNANPTNIKEEWLTNTGEINKKYEDDIIAEFLRMNPQYYNSSAPATNTEAASTPTTASSENQTASSSEDYSKGIVYENGKTRWATENDKAPESKATTTTITEVNKKKKDDLTPLEQEFKTAVNDVTFIEKSTLYKKGRSYTPKEMQAIVDEWKKFTEEGNKNADKALAGDDDALNNWKDYEVK